MAKKKRKNASQSPAAKAAASNAQQSQQPSAAKPSYRGKLKAERIQQSKQPVGIQNKSSSRQRSSLAFANWDDPMTMLHYMFLFTIFVSINAFHLSGTIGGPSVTDHLFVKNFYTTVVFMPITILFVGLTFWQSKKLVLPKSALTYLLVGFFLYACLGLYWGNYKGFVVTKLTIWWVGLLAFFWAYDVVRRGGLIPLIQVIFFSGVVVALIGLWQVYFEYSPTQYADFKAKGIFPNRLVDMAAGPSSTFGNRNMANHLIVLTAPLAVYLIGTTKTQRFKISYFIGLAAILLFSFHTQTRSAYIAIAIELFLILIFVLPRSYRLIAYVGSLLLAFTALYLLNFQQLGWIISAILFMFFTCLLLWPKVESSLLHWKRAYTVYGVVVFSTALLLANYSYVNSEVVPFWDVLLGRVEATANGLQAGTVHDDFGNSASNLRIQIWRDAWEVFKSSPIVGVGLGSFYAAFHFEAFDVVNDSAIRYAHNEYFTIITELGLIGLVFFIALVTLALKLVGSTYMRLLRNSSENNGNDKILLLVCIVAAALGTMINATFTFPYEYVSPYIVVSCFLAIILFLNQSNGTVKSGVSQNHKAEGAILQIQGSKGVILSLLIAVLCSGALSLNLYWNKRISQANQSISINQWIPIAFDDSEWLLHANYFWTLPAYLGQFKSLGHCHSVDQMADSILAMAPDYYSGRFEQLSCSLSVTNVDRTLSQLREADLVSTYLRDSAWDNLLRLGFQFQKPYLIKDHLAAMEAKYLTRPQGVQHRYANSLGRRFYQFALKLSPEAKAVNLAKASEYLSLAIEAKPINTKYKADLVAVYIAQNNIEAAKSLTQQIATQNPESKLLGGLQAQLGL